MVNTGNFRLGKYFQNWEYWEVFSRYSLSLKLNSKCIICDEFQNMKYIRKSSIQVRETSIFLFNPICFSQTQIRELPEDKGV